MTEPSEITDGSLLCLGRRLARTRKMCTNLTLDEERQISVAAMAQGKALSEWVREVLLDGANAAKRAFNRLPDSRAIPQIRLHQIGHHHTRGHSPSAGASRERSSLILRSYAWSTRPPSL